MSKIWNKTTIGNIAALLAYAVTTLILFIPVKGENQMSLVNWSSPMGVSIIVVFVISFVLFFISIFMREKKQKYHDIETLLKNRKAYLVPLKSIIQERLSVTSRLAKEASELPLSEYQKKYLNFKHQKHNSTVLTALFLQGFLLDNLYYDFLKSSDAKYKQLKQDYDIYFPQIDSRELKKELEILWDYEHKINSEDIAALLMQKNPNVPYSIKGLRSGRKWTKYSRDLLDRKLTVVMNLIDNLCSGGDYELYTS